MHVCKGFEIYVKVHQSMRVLTINIIITTGRTGSRKINIKCQHDNV